MSQKPYRAEFYRVYATGEKETLFFFCRSGVLTFRSTSEHSVRKTKRVTEGALQLRDLPTIWDLALDFRLDYLVIPFYRGGRFYTPPGFQPSAMNSTHVFLDHPNSVRLWLRDTVGDCILLLKKHERNQTQVVLTLP